MRKIEFKKDSEKRRRRNQLLLGGFLVFTMLFSTLGYAFQSFGGHLGGNLNGDSELSVVQFNGFDFTQQSGFWVMDFYGTSLIFRYSPSEIFGLDFVFNPLSSYEAKNLYIYSENVNAKSEIRSNLFSFVESIENACLENIENCKDTVKTCDENFIVIRKSEKREIRQEGNCVFIEGGEGDLTKLTDEFIYKLLGAA